jgi:hypothetical protein
MAMTQSIVTVAIDLIKTLSAPATAIGEKKQRVPPGWLCRHICIPAGGTGFRMTRRQFHIQMDDFDRAPDEAL